MLSKSYIYAPIILLLTFLACIIVVLGAKALISSIKLRFAKPEPPKPKPVTARKRVSKPKQPATIRSIEINPQEIDRIYVKRAE